MARNRGAAVRQGERRRTPPGVEALALDVNDDDDEQAELDTEVDDDTATTALAADELSDGLGEQTAEVNVEGLIAELESESRRSNRSNVLSAKRKLEEYLEELRLSRAIEDFEDSDIDN